MARASQIEAVTMVQHNRIGAKDSFKNHTIKELAKMQGIPPAKGLKALAGGWPLDQDVDAFLGEIYTSR